MTAAVVPANGPVGATRENTSSLSCGVTARLSFGLFLSIVGVAFVATLALLHLNPEGLVGNTYAMYFHFLEGPVPFVMLGTISVALAFRVFQFLYRLCCGARKWSGNGEEDETSSRVNLGPLQSFVETILFPVRMYKTTFGDESDFGVFGKYYQLKLIAGEVTETVLQLYNFERYLQAGVSSRAVIIYAVVYSFSLGALPWMLLHENVWIHRDAPLIMDLCLDLFYSAIFPMNIAMLSALARGTYMEQEGEFWVGTTRGVTIVRATIAIPDYFRLFITAYPLLSLYFHLGHLVDIADDASSGGKATMNFRQRMSVRRVQNAHSGKSKERLGGEEAAEEEQDLAKDSTGVKSVSSRAKTVAKRDTFHSATENALSTTAQQASGLSSGFKLSLAVAATTLSICVLLLAVRVAVIMESGGVCDSSDDVFKRCVMRVNTLSPFADTSQCPCLALHGDCESTDAHRGIGAVVDGDAFLTRVQATMGNDLLYMYAPGCNLTRLWPGRAAFPNLVFVNLARNDFKAMPKDFGSTIGVLPDLIALQVDDTGLLALPETFASVKGAFPSLRNLQLGRNKLQTLPASFTAVPGALPELRQLFLSGNELGNLPARFGSSVPELTGVFLSNNKLQSLPPSFTTTPGALAKLRRLILNNNNLSELSGDFALHVPELTHLSLANNKLQSLPSSFTTTPGALAKLYALYLNNNNLSELPGDFALHVPELTHLSLANNKLQSLPSSFTTTPGALAKLWGLHLNNNSLSELPGDFALHVPELSRLYLQNNNLQSLPPSFTTTPGALAKLLWLRLENNNLRELPPGFTSSTRGLSALTLGQNNLSGALPQLVLSLPNLHRLDLSCNSFSGTGAALATGLALSGERPTPLRHLWLQDNELTFDDLDASQPSSSAHVHLLKSAELYSVSILNNTMTRSDSAGGSQEEAIRWRSKWPAFDFDDPRLLPSTEGAEKTAADISTTGNGSNVTYRVVGAYSPPTGTGLAAVATAFDAMMLEPPAGFRASGNARGGHKRCPTVAQWCGNLWVWGGHGQFGAGVTAHREFQTRGAHTSVRLRLAVAILDTWDPDEAFVVKVDGRKVWHLEVGSIAAAHEHWCGGSSSDVGLVVADLIVAHTGEAASVELLSTLDESEWNESWGLVGAEFTLSNQTV